MHTTSIVQAPSLTLASGITIPDSKMAREVTELVRDIWRTRRGLLVATMPLRGISRSEFAVLEIRTSTGS